MTAPLSPAPGRPVLDYELEALLDYTEEHICSSCAKEFRREGDTLCSACRAEIDAAYADLPGAEP